MCRYAQFGVPAVHSFVSGAECLPEEREDNGEMEVWIVHGKILCKIVKNE